MPKEALILFVFPKVILSTYIGVYNNNYVSLLSPTNFFVCQYSPTNLLFTYQVGDNTG